jgi:hypothetical protein
VAQNHVCDLSYVVFNACVNIAIFWMCGSSPVVLEWFVGFFVCVIRLFNCLSDWENNLTVSKNMELWQQQQQFSRMQSFVADKNNRGVQ